MLSKPWTNLLTIFLAWCLVWFNLPGGQAWAALPPQDEPTDPSAEATSKPSLDPATEAAIRKWARYFDRSVLSEEERIAELRWFAQAAAPFRGRRIRSVAEDIKTHYWERDVLTQAFQEITGIQVEHEVIGEGSVVERMVEQQRTGRILYDIYVNDADMVGTHLRSQGVVNLSAYMDGPGRPFTNPGLDLDDFLNLEFGQDYEGNQLQLPDQQFVNLYWFRYDWFTDPAIQEAFRAEYGYELGVPLNWAAYEDIAAFFTGREIDGQTVYGHLDYGKKSPSLGWRFTDAWLSMAGTGDEGIPNGVPVDEWGIRAENCVPVGSSVTRGGATNAPSAVYALDKYIEWLKQYAPADAAGMTFSEAGPVPAQGAIAQQIFWYTAFTADMTKPGLPVVNEDGTPKWRMAPSPHGAYWREGMKLGYQDAGSWTLLKSTPADRRAAAWLYAQFTVAKSTSLKKSIVGLTFIRDSDIRHDYFTENAAKYGGLVEFYRSPARVQWTPTGVNVPDYPKLAQLWWQNVAPAITGEVTSQQAMDNLAAAQDEVLSRLERIGLNECSPKLNEERDAQYWFDQPGAPFPKLADERGTPETIDYDTLLQTWQDSQ